MHLDNRHNGIFQYSVVTIVNVDVGTIGAYTIGFDDGRTKDTTVYRLQPVGGVNWTVNFPNTGS